MTSEDSPVRVFRDREIRWFYAVVGAGLTIWVVASVAVRLQQGGYLWLAALSLATLLGFLAVGWPTRAWVCADGTVVFANLVRRVTLREGGVARIRLVRDALGGHLRLVPVGPLGAARAMSYRVCSFDDFPELARAVLTVASASTRCTWGPGAREFLVRASRS